MSISTETNGSIPETPLTLQHLLQADPDLVDRIFEYILAESPEFSAQVQKCKNAVRKEFAGEIAYIPSRSAAERQHNVSQVKALFNGRNAPELARRLNISRATIYRYNKQSSG